MRNSTTWRDIDETYRHIYIAPHMDDAALSCGGAMLQQATTGEPVVVVTICAGSPDPAGPFNALAEEMHTEYGVPGGEAVALRLREDAAANTILHSDTLWLDYLDAIYRLPDSYYSNDTIFGAVAPDDPLAPHIAALIMALAQRSPHATIYLPLGVGNHVDHQAAFLAGEAAMTYGAPVLFYEDYPYARDESAVQKRLDAIGGRWQATSIGIDTAFERKLDAIDAYATQVERIFGGSNVMRADTLAYAKRIAPMGSEYGERLWQYS